MSGGVGPTGGGGICLLPPEESSAVAESERKALHDSSTMTSSPHGRFLSFRQLNALAVVTVLSASGMVAAEDLAFAAFSLAYLYFLSTAAFPSPSPSSSPQPPIFGARNRTLTAWVSAGALLGLILPVAYILEGVVEGDKEGIRAAAPHVFLLSCQVFAEGVTFTRRFSLPMRAFVPVFYNTKRLFALSDWVRAELVKAGEDVEGASGRRLLVGRGLAVANLAFWAFNLFGFLLPVYLPRALKRHYAPAPPPPPSAAATKEAKM